MSESAGKMVEGVFAINKPQYISSAQLLRELQARFRSSRLFAPRLEWQSQQASKDQKRAKWKRRAAAENVKIGHGGTLDPLATGVLVIGVGNGTKQLQSFLGCTKTYETVILFGKSTDTYDVAGKVVFSASHEHVTEALVKEKLKGFRGKIKQVPPIYSALKIDGMKAYDYARTGRQLPRELEARDMEVLECELVEWYEGGTHEFRWPATEASKETRQIAKGLIGNVHDEQQGDNTLSERKLSDLSVEGTETWCASEQVISKKVTDEASKSSVLDPPLSHDRSRNENSPTDPPQPPSPALNNRLSAAEKARVHTHEIGPLSPEICSAPAARIRVTTSSGFYVRSLAHDLGIACGSLAIMATLFRSRQAGFDSSSALGLEDLEAEEAVWGPKLQTMLNYWNEKNSQEPRFNDRNTRENTKVLSVENEGGQRYKRRKGRPQIHGEMRRPSRERRNTSSEEE